MPARRSRSKYDYVPETEDILPATRPAALLSIPAESFKSKDALRAALRGTDYAPATPSQPKAQTKLGKALTATLTAAAGSDGAPLRPLKRSRAETKINAEVEAANLPSYKTLTPVRTTRLGRPVKTYPKFHWT